MSAKLLKPAQAAEILDVSVETLNVWRCTKRYPLKYIKIGRSVKYRLSDIQDFIKESVITCAEI